MRKNQWDAVFPQQATKKAYYDGRKIGLNFYMTIFAYVENEVDICNNYNPRQPIVKMAIKQV